VWERGRTRPVSLLIRLGGGVAAPGIRRVREAAPILLVALVPQKTSIGGEYGTRSGAAATC
jgi:hypothetical protein